MRGQSTGLLYCALFSVWLGTILSCTFMVRKWKTVDHLVVSTHHIKPTPAWDHPPHNAVLLVEGAGT